MKIEVNNLEKRFNGLYAIQDLCINLDNNWNCLGILGRNGAGKTTLIRMLVGLLRPDGGTIQISYNDAQCNHLSPQTSTYIAENDTLIHTITGTQYLRLYESMNQLARVEVDNVLREELIKKFSLEPELNKTISKMSKGTKRKLELVAAVSSNVRLVVSDELTNGLDIPSRIALEKTICGLMERGNKKFLISSHDLSFITSTCDSVLIIDHGKCVDFFSIDKVVSDIKEKVSKAFGLLNSKEII